MNKAFEKILERLRNLAENYGRLQFGFNDSCEIQKYVGMEQALDLAIETVQEVAEEYKDGWIPCSEKLPKDDDYVLCWYEYRIMQGSHVGEMCEKYDIGYFMPKIGKWGGEVANGVDCRVIAWQPLPEQYKEITQE